MGKVASRKLKTFENFNFISISLRKIPQESNLGLPLNGCRWLILWVLMADLHTCMCVIISSTLDKWRDK